jgi:hypothetical protein
VCCKARLNKKSLSGVVLVLAGVGVGRVEKKGAEEQKVGLIKYHNGRLRRDLLN